MTNLDKAKAKAEKEKFLNSPEGIEAVRRLSAANELSAALAAKVIQGHKERKDELSELSQSLVDKLGSTIIKG